MKIKISEHFYSIQGEGKTMGIPAIFIRLKACNLLCGGYGTQKDGQLYDGATWRCDTLEVWTKGITYTIEEAAILLIENYGEQMKAGAHLVWTGGEPLMQQKAIIEVMKLLAEEKYLPFVEVETNGTIEPLEELDYWIDLYNVSPKLANSGMPKDKRHIPEVIEFFNSSPNSIFKFVISNQDNWNEIQGFNVDRNKIYLMPNAEDLTELKTNQNFVADLCIKECVKFCTRLQIELWNKTTGV